MARWIAFPMFNEWFIKPGAPRYVTRTAKDMANSGFVQLLGM